MLDNKVNGHVPSVVLIYMSHFTLKTIVKNVHPNPSTPFTKYTGPRVAKAD